MAADAGGKSLGHRSDSAEARDLHLRRARETGRGRDATSPLQIPLTGYGDILWRVYGQLQEDRVLSIAGGVVFYGVLAIFPGIAAVLSVYALFSDPTEIARHVSVLRPLVPENAFGIISGQVQRIAEQSGGSLGLSLIVGVLLALWSMLGGVKALIDAMNIIYEEEDRRSFLRLNLVALAFALGAAAVLLLAIAALVVLPFALAFLGLSGWAGTLTEVMRWPVLLVLLLLGLVALYRYGPHRNTARWQWISVGSIFATLAWIGSSYLLSWYFANFAHYQATYGSLGAAVGLLLWLWVTVIVVLVGAELNAEIEHQTARDSTVGPEKPLGDRGAQMADTVGAAWGSS